MKDVKLQLIDASSRRLIDEIDATCSECKPVLSGGQLIGATLQFKLERPLAAYPNGTLVVEIGVKVVFEGVSVAPPPAPATPKASQPKADA